MTRPIRLATRGSPLARWQADHVAGLLAPRPVEFVFVRTEGDRVQNVSLSVLGGQGVFTKEVQLAVLRGDADVAVHSLKDLPTEETRGLVLAAVPFRGPAGDALVSNRYARWDDLPPGARVASGSLRRRALIKNRRNDITLVDLRGNVETRLQKLDDGDLDAIVLAEAGLVRLRMEDRIREVLNPHWFVRAVGQGALGLECRADDTDTQDALASLDCPVSHAAVTAERAFLRELGGGCQVPIAAAGQVVGDELSLHGVVLSVDGTSRLDGQVIGPIGTADELGRQLADDLLARGANKLLQTCC
ncbi:MAG: hydroxymethylbilane synthase [Gemmataceae bacterium]|nr:hydroxymethylbilane synthase [Gemmataceae bacterium]